MMSRVEKVGEAIKNEISDIIHLHLKDPRIGFITVTRVELTKDLRFARVYYSILGDEKHKKEGQEGIDSAGGFIRRELGQRLTLKFLPELVFKLDESIGHSIRVQEILGEIEKEKDEHTTKDNTEDKDE